MNDTNPELIDTDLFALIEKRISTRGYLDKLVNNEQLEKLMEIATRAPTWKNAQSYKVVFLTGAKKDQLLTEMTQAVVVDQKEPTPIYAYENTHPSHIKKRMFGLGMELYAHMGIERKDKIGRQEHFKQNYKAFDAPVVAFFYIPTKLGEWSILDLGILIGNICLVAEGLGLATCAQASLSIYPEMVSKYTGQDDNMKMILGMSLGYADPDHKNNSFISSRAPLSEVMEII